MFFKFSTANQILFGKGVVAQAGGVAASFGKRALFVVGSGSVSLANLFNSMQAAGIDGPLLRIVSEPVVDTILEGLKVAKEESCCLVVACGGGSVLDAGKAIAALMNNPGELMDYLEVIGEGKDIPNAPAPMIAIPTTAGTGTEVTRNAVITSTEHHVKVSMRSLKMIPKVAIVDPELTYSMPPKVTASTGMDALTQVVEAYMSKNANLMTDLVCREGIKRGSKALLQAYKNGADQKAREDMSLVSLFGGLALANGGLGAVHGIAGPIGGMFAAPHGAICAALLPYVVKYNALASKEEADSDMIKLRYKDIAKWVTGNSLATIEDGVTWFSDLSEALEIPRLNTLGIKETDFPEIIKKSKVSSSMQNNPLKLHETFLEAILQEAY